jgi:FkbM family methyltransferase
VAKILLDVGAHTGQTIRPALDPAYGFERVVAFEPAPSCWPEIEAIGDPRVQLCRFGLWKETCRLELHDAGSQAASLIEDFENEDPAAPAAIVDLVRARDWVRQNVSDGDIVFMKLNCEGSECDIVEDLLDSGELRKIYNAMITFDVRKSESLRGRERPLRRRLLQSGYENVAFAEDVMRGATHADRIRHWLDLVGARETLPPAELRRKYADTLRDLSHRTGRLARFEQWLRVHVFRRLPSPFKATARNAWGRLMRGRRQGPE